MYISYYVFSQEQDCDRDCDVLLIDWSSSTCSRPVTSGVIQVYTRAPFWVNARGNAISGVNISRDTNNLGTWPVYYTHAAECLGNHYPRRFIGRGREVTYARLLSARMPTCATYLDVSIIASVNRHAFPPSSVRPLRSTSTSAIAVDFEWTKADFPKRWISNIAFPAISLMNTRLEFRGGERKWIRTDHFGKSDFRLRENWILLAYISLLVTAWYVIFLYLSTDYIYLIQYMHVLRRVPAR